VQHSHSHAAGDAGSERRGVEHADVIDMIGEDPATGTVVLAMEETRAWDGSELRLFQLQEKFNAYLSFALDGEMREAYPALADRPIRVRLNTVLPPDRGSMRLLRMIARQMGFQGISLEIMVAGVRVTLPETADDHSV
jgi:hypothetical protein